ncbi:hypothetical protein AVEN_194257-1 [Araneus ventricosus]|uniref:Uncharacterized protein n=1 Tax=Araneus ventricosus TaxID=182803 RepID=A0A4Y2GDQ3_ARAVE|nr:hypothetical protein AVEN_194257-1 [Araneus ventricosus]
MYPACPCSLANKITRVNLVDLIGPVIYVMAGENLGRVQKWVIQLTGVDKNVTIYVLVVPNSLEAQGRDGQVVESRLQQPMGAGSNPDFSGDSSHTQAWCMLNLSRVKYTAVVVEAWVWDCQLKCRPHNLTTVQYYETLLIIALMLLQKLELL